MQWLWAQLLLWYESNHRQLPWRQDREPYHVWLSEIMLQQTRVEAVKEYYLRFLQRLPTLQALAEASEDVLLKLWEGLGYYSRVRNLQKAAVRIMEKHGGVFPKDYDEILALPGIGPYTAGAICSICFDAPTPAVDGNVLRVMSRLFASDRPVNEEGVKRYWTQELKKAYPTENCGLFTQALMELGATVCLPNGKPLCGQCPLQAQCLALAADRCQSYPVKGEKKPRRTEQRTVFILSLEDRLGLCKRPQQGLLAGLWQFPDVPGELNDEQAIEQAELWGLHPTGIQQMLRREHIFTHVKWELTGYYLSCAAEGELQWFTREQLREQIGLPTAYRQFLQE